MKNDNSINLSVVEKIIDKLIQNYHSRPYSYFSECELQYELYCMFVFSDKFNHSLRTNDGREVGLVHPEYPSVNRVKLDRGKGYRVWYDLAILNPDFIKMNSYETIIARDERSAKLWGENILAAFEFKFFTKNRVTNIKSVKDDCSKLSLCPEINNKYVLAFSNYPQDFIDLQDIEVHDTKLYWITPGKIYKSFSDK